MRLKILTDGVEVLPLNAENPTLNEIRSAIKDLKIRKVPGYDITNEPIRADLKTSVKQILLTKIWDDETRPTDWKKSPDIILPTKWDLTCCGNCSDTNNIQASGENSH